MSFKRVIGVILVVIGIFIILFASRMNHRVMEAKKMAAMKNASEQNLGAALMETRTSRAELQVTWLFIGGIVVVIVGVGLSVFTKMGARG